MIHPQVSFEGFDPASFARWVEVFRGPDDLRDASSRVGTLVIVVNTNERVLAAVHSRRGRVANVVLDADLEKLAVAHGVRRVVIVREGALEELAERLALRLRRSDDFLAQLWTLAQVVRELVSAGSLRFHPPRWADLPLPSVESVHTLFDLVLPNDHSALIVLTEGRSIATAIAVRRREGSLDRIVGPRRIETWSGPLAGDIRRDHRYFAEAVDHELAPLHIAVSANVDAFERLVREHRPGAWATAVAMRDVIVDPAPAWTGLAVGVDAVRSLIAGLGRALGDLDLRAIGSHGEREEPFLARVLGFDPADALTRAFDRFRGDE